MTVSTSPRWCRLIVSLVIVTFALGMPGVGPRATQHVAFAAGSDAHSFGLNDPGQLGDGTSTNRSTPVAVSGLSGVTAVAAGWYHSLAVKDDGTVWSWGYNSDGQLGDGTTTHRSTPVAVSGLSGITAVAAGTSHSLAVTGDGTVWSWGYNGFGGLGDGMTMQRSTPGAVSGLSGIRAVAAGAYHSLASGGGSPPVNQLPSATADDAGGIIGAEIALTATTADPDGDVLTYTWSIDTTDCAIANTGVEDTTVTCSREGTFTATLSVTDGTNPAVTATAIITVTRSNVPPTVRIEGLPAGEVSEGTELTLTASVVDPDEPGTPRSAWSVTKNGTLYASGSDATFSLSLIHI